MKYFNKHSSLGTSIESAISKSKNFFTSNSSKEALKKTFDLNTGQGQINTALATLGIGGTAAAITANRKK